MLTAVHAVQHGSPGRRILPLLMNGPACQLSWTFTAHRMIPGKGGTAILFPASGYLDGNGRTEDAKNSAELEKSHLLIRAGSAVKTIQMEHTGLFLAYSQAFVPTTISEHGDFC